jgi:hypothetical protein
MEALIVCLCAVAGFLLALPVILTLRGFSVCDPRLDCRKGKP